MTPGTARQQAILEFVRRYRIHNRMSPTLDQIAEAVGLKSKGAVGNILKSMEQRGLIRRWPGRRRSIEIVDDLPELVERLLRNILEEDLETGTVTVRSVDIADLDIALSDHRPRLKAPLHEYV